MGPWANGSLGLFAKMFLWLERVPSEENIADLPSREAYELVAERLKATWQPPCLAQLFKDESHQLSTEGLLKLKNLPSQTFSAKYCQVSWLAKK